MKILREYIAELLRESYALTSMSIPEAMDYMSTLEGHNIIFFDTETLGFTPKHQITQIAAMVVPLQKWGQDPIVTKEFDQKAKRTPETMFKLYTPRRPPEPGKRPRKNYADVLKMTQYYDEDSIDDPAGSIDEEELLQNFIDFCSSVSNPVYAAHNAKFDMRMVNARAKEYGLSGLPSAPVLDTLSLVKFFVRPALKSAIAGSSAEEIAKRATPGRDVSARLGDLASAMDIDIENWHNAKADVEMMFKVIGNAVVLLSDEEQYDLEKAEKLSKKERERYKRTKKKVRKKQSGMARRSKMGKEIY